MATATADAPIKNVVSVRDVMAMLDVSEGTVYAWIKAGKLPKPFHVGKVIRWRRQAIEALFHDAGQADA